MNLQKTHIYTKFPHTENTRNAHRQEYSVTLTTVFHSLQSCPITYKTHIATELAPGPKFGSKNSGRFKMKILADYAYTLGYLLLNLSFPHFSRSYGDNLTGFLAVLCCYLHVLGAQLCVLSG